ncbi:hypothetical protein TRIUR3_15666 [Triticum urartu]|uniref:Uncharacterized protein n=1 Tax=Triticum urartu TaxID=4572 RepID=M8AL41_TRIUA|nr:hypothetical protein TRIUR3_15666 [Triticum urartu]
MRTSAILFISIALMLMISSDSDGPQQQMCSQRMPVRSMLGKTAKLVIELTAELDHMDVKLYFMVYVCGMKFDFMVGRVITVMASLKYTIIL